MRRSRWLPDAGALFVLLLLPLLLFWPVTAGSRTLLPADNLYQWQPYRTFARELGVDLPPHNELLSDLVLENMVWKQFIVDSLRAGQLPMWNPHLFAGVPFLAAGQHSALYPLSGLFYVLPLARAYGLFTVLQLWLAGISMYALARVLHLGRWGALVAAIVYQLSAFFLVSVVFTMIIAAAAWLPLLLAVIERVMQKQEEKGSGPFVPIVYILIGAVALGVHVLAGHPEILVYTLLVMAYYALVRLVMVWRRVGAWQPSVRIAIWLVVMVALGLALGSVQLVPLFELVTQNFREGSVSYADVTGWAFPVRQVVTFLVPDFFGNPSHHGYWDLVTRQWVALDRAAGTHWGIKNYVEAGSYVGILPLLLALVALVPARWPWARGERKSAPAQPLAAQPDRRHVWIFGALALASLLFVFGTPLYALLYYGLPGINQLHSPFRWVWPYTLSVAVLAGMGIGRLEGWKAGRLASSAEDGPNRSPMSNIQSLLGWGAVWVGGLLLVGLGVAFVAPQTFVPVAERLLGTFETAQPVFESARAFLSYQWRNLLYFALMLLTSGILLLLSRLPIHLPLPNLPIYQSTNL
ncbi:MAG TPA: YfhO family protein, partial [Anaerolineae bacterium]|nr:YfhO family protein [Anaerolineae bacterium]